MGPLPGAPSCSGASGPPSHEGGCHCNSGVGCLVTCVFQGLDAQWKQQFDSLCCAKYTTKYTFSKYSEERRIAKMSLYVFRLEDATSLITLYHMLHPECQSAKETKKGNLKELI